jgi:hypothetical protein
VIGWHLVVFPRQIGHRLLGRTGFRRDVGTAGAGERDVRAGRIGDLRAGPAHELVHIAGVVGEQHERLEMLHRGAGVVPQTRQREIRAQRIEMRQREMVVGGVIQAVGGLVTDLRQLGGGEMLRDAGAH